MTIPMTPEKEQPLISLITLNYNQLQVTTEFIESTKKLTYPNFEIVLVDNASKEDPTEFITTRYPHVVFIRSNENLGFTGGNNLGIEAAKGDYYFVVNNDTEVTADLLERLIEPFYADPTVGAVSPKIMYFTEPTIIQYAGFTEINPITGRNSCIGAHEEDKGQRDVPGYTAYAHGAAMLVKKEVVEKVGGLADLFFIYYEELDWSARIRKAGYTIFYQPTGMIYHKESVTMGTESALKAYYHNRNRILFMRRNSSSMQFSLFFVFLVLFIIPKTTLGYIYKGKATHLKNLYRGLFWNLKTSKIQ